MRKHGLSSPECKIDGFDGAGDSPNGSRIDAQNVDSTQQIRDAPVLHTYLRRLQWG